MVIQPYSIIYLRYNILQFVDIGNYSVLYELESISWILRPWQGGYTEAPFFLSVQRDLAR